MERYDLETHTRGMEIWQKMERREDGDWVLYEDVAKLTHGIKPLLKELIMRTQGMNDKHAYEAAILLYKLKDL